MLELKKNSQSFKLNPSESFLFFQNPAITFFETLDFSYEKGRQNFGVKFMIPIKEKTLEKYTFIDLFAGLEGFRLALESLGAKCVYSSE